MVRDNKSQTMGRCATCQHWESDADREGPIEVRRCRFVPMWNNTLEWGTSNYEEKFRPEFEGRLAFAVDGSTYYAALITAAEFGCVQWSAAATPTEK